MRQAQFSAAKIAEGQIASLQALNIPPVQTNTLGASKVAKVVVAEARQQEVEEQQKQMMETWIVGLTRAEPPASLAECLTLQSLPLVRLHGGCSLLADRYKCCCHICLYCGKCCWKHHVAFSHQTTSPAFCHDIQRAVKIVSDSSTPSQQYKLCIKSICTPGFVQTCSIQFARTLCHAIAGSRRARVAVHRS